MPHMERCTPNSYVTPLNQRVWVGSKRRASQYQIDDHASSSLKAIFHCGRFARAGGAANFNHVKNQSRGRICQRMRPCLKRIQRMPNVPLAYVSVYRRMSDIFHTLAYARCECYRNCQARITRIFD